MRNGMADPMVPDLFEVMKMRSETQDTFTLELRPRAQERPVSFAAGQFNMLYLFGVGEVPVSISGDPADTARLVHTTRAVGTVTSAMKTLKAGTVVGVRGPFGRAWPVESAAGMDLLVMSGGIGLAPLRPVVYRILAARHAFGSVTLLYGTRTPADLLFERELKQWRAHFDLDVHVTVDHAMGDWHGHIGVVTKLVPRATFEPANTRALVCGPEVMMRYAAIELEQTGIPDTEIYLSMERNMKCAVGFCGHCQYGPEFICKDGPVFSYRRLKKLLEIREL